KPRITWLILMSTGVGYFFGLDRTASLNWPLLIHTIVGTGLIASGTAALNQWWERESDKLMRRTAGRPLPMGLMTARRALWFGIALAVAGAAELWIWVNPLSSILGLFTLAAYLFVYADEVADPSFDSRRRAPRRGTAADGIRRFERHADPRSVEPVLHPFHLAVSSFPGDRLDVSRRLRPRRHSDAAGGRA